MSIVPGVRFTWVIVSSDNEISLNVRHNGTGTTPPISIVATALSNGGQSTIGGSQVLDAGWSSPNSMIVRVNGSSSLYDADLITVVVSPYGLNTDCHPSYPGLCLPFPPADIDCFTISQKGFSVLSPDPYDLDRDDDGLGCEE